MASSVQVESVDPFVAVHTAVAPCEVELAFRIVEMVGQIDYLDIVQAAFALVAFDHCSHWLLFEMAAAAAVVVVDSSNSRGLDRS